MKQGPGWFLIRNWHSRLCEFGQCTYELQRANVIRQRGYYQLDRGVTAYQQAKYYFQGQLEEATARSTLVGPVDGKDYTYR